MMRRNTRGRPPCEEDMPVTMLVNELSRLFHNEMRQESSAIGMKNGYRHLLFHLAKEENLSQLELAERTHLKAPTISVTLTKMEAEGLVTKTVDPADARSIRVSLTEKGRALDDRMRERIMQKDRVFTESLSEEEVVTLRTLLIRIRRHLFESGWGEGCASGEPQPPSANRRETDV